MVVSNRYNWMFWSCESLTCLLLSLRAVFSTMLEFLLLCDFAEAMASDSFWEPLQLVLLVVNSILSDFCLFQGCYLFCLNFNFYGFGVLLLGNKKG